MPEAATLYCFLRSHFCQDKCTTNKTFNLPKKEKKRKHSITSRANKKAEIKRLFVF
jgi:hypothetical protein